MERMMSEAQTASRRLDTGDLEIDAARLQSLFTIGDMARLYGLTLRALRFYEDRGLIVPLRHGTRRFYNAASRTRLETVLRAKDMGFTLTQIRAMLARDEGASPSALGLDAGNVEVQIGLLERKRERLERAIEDLRIVHRRMNRLAAGTAAIA